MSAAYTTVQQTEKGATKGTTMARQKKEQGSETLLYVQAMLGQLRTMAEAEKCDMLAYLIEMAYVEASDIVRGERPSRVNKDKRDTAA